MSQTRCIYWTETRCKGEKNKVDDDDDDDDDDGDDAVYLLDDILSGVDEAVAQHIMQRCVLGLLRRAARVLVSHSPRHLAKASHVVLLDAGRIVKQGT
jgi:hypothetical protein